MNEFEPHNDNIGHTQNTYQTVYQMPEKRDKYLSGVFFALVYSLIGGLAIVFGVQLLILYKIPEMIDNSWVAVGMSIFETALSMLLFVLFLPASDKTKHPVTAKLSFKATIRFCIISAGIMFAGAFAGSVFSVFFAMATGIEPLNAVEELVANLDFLTMIVGVVIIAPVFEELFFRKYLVDALARYGTVFCCVVSGITFGLFHGNFYQFFYAFGLGMLLAYIYCVYGKIRYPIILHSVINFFGSVFPLAIGVGDGTNVELETIYSLVYLVIAISGICMLIKDIKWFRCYAVKGCVEKPFEKIINPGFVVLMIVSVLFFAIYML